MTTDEMNAIQAAKLDLLNHAVIYSLKTVEEIDNRDVEQKLLMAAKNWTRIVDRIDPKLWEPTSVCIEP